MELPHESVLLRIFIGESDRHGHRPLYEAIVLKAREQHLAGATVLRGAMGFGKSSRMHTSKILRLSIDLPLVIEIVDSEEKINAFLPVLDPPVIIGSIKGRKALIFSSLSTTSITNGMSVERRRILLVCMRLDLPKPIALRSTVAPARCLSRALRTIAS